MESRNFASLEAIGNATRDDVLSNLFAACKGVFLDERRQATVNLRRAERAEQERDEALAELRAAKLQLAGRLQRDPYAGLQNTMVVCLIDADGAIPQFNRLRDGFNGGQQAAKDLRAYLLNYIEEQGLPRSNVSVIVSAYCNQKGLRDTLVGGNHCDNAQFSQFWNGFQSAGLFCLIDVGQKKEAADAKIHAAMLLYARMPQVSRLFLGVAHDGGYHHPLSTLINEGLVEKIVLLRSFVEELPLDLRDLRLAEGRLDGLFLVNKLHTPRRSRNTSLPPTPKMNPAQGGHRRSDSYATESSNWTAAQDTEFPLSDDGSELLETNHKLGLVVEDGDKDVPPISFLEAAHQSRTLETSMQDRYMLLLGDNRLAQLVEDIRDGGVEGPEPPNSPPIMLTSQSLPNALANADRMAHGTQPELMGLHTDPLPGSSSVTTGDESTITVAVSGHGSGKPRPARATDVKPCAFYYCLERCVRRSSCRYAHNLTLNAEELEALRNWAISTPCVYLRQYRPCPYYEGCCMAHQCPHTGVCKARNCKFPVNMRCAGNA